MNIYTPKHKFVKFIEMNGSFSKFRNQLVKHSGLDKSDINIDDCITIRNEIFDPNADGVVIFTDMDHVPKDDRFMIINKALFKELFV